MPSEAVSLALAASIYPPALAVVIALGRGPDVRLRVVVLVLASFLTVFVTGSLMLLLFTELGATSQQVRAPSAGLYVAAGLVLLALAARLRREPSDVPQPQQGPSRTDRYLQSTRLVALLGVILYVVPSPIYVGVVKVIADTHASTGQQLVYLLQALLLMLWLIEVPMLMLVLFPTRAAGTLESVNAWFARHGRSLGVLTAALLGLYLLGVGLVELV
jgi:hypothetical protein